MLEQRLTEAAQAAPERCWLLLERLQHRFPLPCPTGQGTVLAEAALGQILNAHPSFFDSSLSCRYCHFLQDGQGYFVLYDTEETLRHKLELAKAAGFQGAVVLTS